MVRVPFATMRPSRPPNKLLANQYTHQPKSLRCQEGLGGGVRVSGFRLKGSGFGFQVSGFGFMV